MSLRPRTALLWGATSLAAALLLCVAVALMLGAESLPLRTILRSEGVGAAIFWQIRLPRVLVAALTGALLSMAGATFQTMMRNPLADPFIIGISGGAACGAAIATVAGLAGNPVLTSLAAFGGALIATVGVLALARRKGLVDAERLLLGGLVLNSFFSALLLLALSTMRGADLTAAMRWMMGGFPSADWRQVLALCVALVVCMVVLSAVARPLRLFIFGEEDAAARGVDVERVKLTAYLAAALGTGVAVAAGGIIGFVGLIIPHLVRRWLLEDFRVVLPLSALGGAALLVSADLLARWAIAPAELPVGALTALIGVPFFLAVLRRSS